MNEIEKEQKHINQSTSTKKDETILSSVILKENEKTPNLTITPTPTKIAKTELPHQAPTIPKLEPQYKEMPREMKILLDALEEFEGIAYAARNKIYQLYGPVDYQIQNSTKHKSLDDIRLSFPEELEAKLDFIEQNDKFIIKAKQFLGTETFAKIASAIRGMGGQYISAGKDSHFEIRKF